MRSTVSAIRKVPVEASSDKCEPWCTVPWGENRWPVTNDNSDEVVAVLDFHYPLANGKLLTEVPDLLAGAKELTRLMRRNANRKMSADQQAAIHRDVLLLMHALSSRRISSLAEVQHQDIIDVVSRMRHGVDGLLQAELRLEAYLALKKDPRDFPDACISNTAKGIPTLNRREIVRLCSLPETILSLPSAARVFARAEKRLGFRRLRKLYSAATPKVVTQPTIDRYAAILRAMFQFRHDMRCESLLFDPLEGEDVGVLLRAGKALEKTPIPPDSLAFALIETCTALIIENGEATVEKHFKLSAAFLTQYDHEVAVLNREAVRSLAVACFVLIACFTGRRLSEICSIRRDCLSGNDGHGWWIKTVILKKSEVEYAWLPIPKLVARAIQLLARLSGYMTGADGAGLLFAYYDPIFDRTVKLSPHSFLNEFASRCGLDTHVDEKGEKTSWHWQARQFRRFFALIYFYRYGGSLEAVSAALRHWDLEITRGYLSLDGNLDAYFRSEEYRFKRKLMEDIANHNGEYIGAAAKRLKQYSEKLRRLFRDNITIMSVDEADLMIRYASKKMMVFRVKPWVTCSCPETAAAVSTAKCHEFPSDKAMGPAIENGGPRACLRKGCVHAIMSAANQNYIRKQAAERAGQSSVPPRNLFESFERMNLVSMQLIGNIQSRRS